MSDPVHPVTFLALPGYNGAHPGAVRAAFAFPTRRYRPCAVVTQTASLLAFNFNSAFAMGVNGRRQFATLKYFGMLHADIEPEDYFLDGLIEELERAGADIMSVVVPIKDMDGLTSTGIADPHNPWTAYLRLTMRQLDLLPETFSSADVGFPGWPLLVNTGCWVCRIDAKWIDDFPGFTINDRLIRNEEGLLVAEVESEDWFASRWWHAHGLKVMATRKVKVLHHGHATYANEGGWGAHDVDPHTKGPVPDHIVPVPELVS